MCLVCLACLVCQLHGVLGVLEDVLGVLDVDLVGMLGVLVDRPCMPDGVQALLDGQFGALGSVLDDTCGVRYGVLGGLGEVCLVSLVRWGVLVECPECPIVYSWNVFLMHMGLPCLVSFSVAISAQDVAAAPWTTLDATRAAEHCLRTYVRRLSAKPLL